MYQLIYCSRFTGTGGALSTVREILAQSQQNNFRNTITGFLIFDKTHFVQVLEGEEATVQDTYARLLGDRRHTDIVVVAAHAVAKRDFPEWSMGGFLRNPEVQHIYSHHGIDGGIDPAALNAGKVVALAKDLLAYDLSRDRERMINIATR
ncbi:MAG: BLUF domain-containing protein [Asticcacaulis sp.]|nr:BLUF domain-containing protein [Asticcacaulis sp.]